MPNSDARLHTQSAIRRNLRTAMVLIVMTGAALTVSAYTPLDGAVVSSGTVVVEGRDKKIQHPTGGVVGEIDVKEGAEVSAGQLLIRLDETETRPNLDIVLNALTTERARLARLQAVRDGQMDPVFPQDLANDPGIRGVLEGEDRLARLQLTSRDEQKRSLLHHIEELRQEIKGLQDVQTSNAGQMEIVKKDLADLKPLYDRGNIQRPRISSLERESLRLQGEISDATAKIAQSEAKIAETELQIVQNDHDFIADVVKQLRESETKINELQEKKIAAEDQLKRLDIRSPIPGIVHELTVHTIGGVVAPSDVLMHIVPSADRLIVEVKVKPSDIDKLAAAQDARIRFSAFDRRKTDQLHGTLVRIGADLTRDSENRPSYYSAAVQISESELAKLNGLKLVPGMPAEVFIKTGERTLAGYIVKPLRDQMERALRER